MAWPRGRERKQDQDGDADYGYEDQRGVLVLKDAECAAGVEGVSEAEKTGGWEGMLILQLVPHHEFAELVDEEDQERQLNQDKVPVDGGSGDVGAQVRFSLSALVLL